MFANMQRVTRQLPLGTPSGAGGGAEPAAVAAAGQTCNFEQFHTRTLTHTHGETRSEQPHIETATMNVCQQ